MRRERVMRESEERVRSGERVMRESEERVRRERLEKTE